MALFQPTNVIPSTLSGEGNGTVDVSKPLTVSWQVNGNSPMVAYRIKIMQNDTDSTLMLDTGKTTLSQPYSGSDRMGNPIPFSVEISVESLFLAGIENGYANGYKMTIQQWWTANDSIEQSSAAFFITRSDPSLILDIYPSFSSFYFEEYTFDAKYFQAQGDEIEWARWELQVLENGEYTTVDDTGNIYNVGVTYDAYYPYYTIISYTHNGFSVGTSGLPGSIGVQYRIRCTVQTESGVQATTGWKEITTTSILAREYATLNVCSEKTTDAVKISMMKNFPLMGVPNGPYEYIYEQSQVFERLSLPSGSTVTWEGEGYASLGIQKPPYVITFKVTIADAGASVDFITAKYRTKDLVFSCAPGGFSIVYGGQTIWSTETAPVSGSMVSFSLHNDSVEFGVRTNDDFSVETFSISPWQGEELDAIVISGPMVFRNIGIEAGNNGTPHGSFYNFAFLPNSWLEVTNDTLFTLAFNHTLYTGGGGIGGSHTYSGENIPIDYLAVYKKEKGSSVIKMLALLPLNEETKDTEILDYSVKNLKEYEYYLFYLYNTYGGFLALQTRNDPAVIKPCFWNYTVLCCDKDDNGDYIVKREYRFALDITSGNVGNNNSPNLQQNFTKYPLRQPTSSRYRSGTLSAYIGKAENGEYVDTESLMEELYALSTNMQTKFLKTRKGQIFRIETSAPVVMNIGDKYAQQPAKISLPWVEVGDAKDANILGTSAYGALPRFFANVVGMSIYMTYSEKSDIGKDSFRIENGYMYAENTGMYEPVSFSINEKGEIILTTD